MSLSVLFFAAVAIVLLAVGGLALRRPARPASQWKGLNGDDGWGGQHVTFFAQVRQALSAEDYAFLLSRLPRGRARLAREERRRVAQAYLKCLRQDFEQLWRLARVVASLSPKVGTAQELARLRLGLAFLLRYQLIRLGFLLGLAPTPGLGSLNEVVSRLASRLEIGIQSLGERAALAAELAPSLDRRGLDTP
ncbi:MAG TPA: hypothetical protein VJN42_08295 [Candidatus Acidoferrum sp.]|nr:hypothetical protein [Candidatus Acidoferrum sp.]